MKHFLLTAAIFLFSILSSFAQEEPAFHYKNNIEVKHISLGLSNSSTSFGSTLLYRRFISPKFALQSEFSYSVVRFKYDFGDGNVFNSFNVGIGAAYFFKPDQSGFYLTSMLSKSNLFRINSNDNLSELMAKIGLGYRANIGKRFYLSGEMNANYNFDTKRFNLSPTFGVGIKF